MDHGLDDGEDTGHMGGQSPPLLTTEGTTAFLGLPLPAQTCAGHQQPMADGRGQSDPIPLLAREGLQLHLGIPAHCRAESLKLL